MTNDSVKEQIINATIKLLTDPPKPGNITARQIVAEAKVNLAMINYYFKSKGALLSIAVGRIMESRADNLKEIYDRDIPPKDKLLEFLSEMTEISMEYQEIIRPALSESSLEGMLDPIHYILPIVRECSDRHKSEVECRLIAMQMISAFQIILLHPVKFTKYSEVELGDREQRRNFIKILIGLYFA